MAKHPRTQSARSKTNWGKAAILSLAMFLSPDPAFSEEINISRPSKYETCFKSDLFRNFEKSLLKKLEENREVLTLNYDKKNGETQYMDMTNMKKKEISKTQRSVLGRARVNAQMDALGKTPIGQSVEKLVDKVSSYTRIKYKKMENEEAKLYLPGNIDKGKKGQYGASLSASLYPTSLSDNDLSIKLKGYRGKLNSELFFRPDTNKMKMNIKYKNFSAWVASENGKNEKIGFIFEKKF